MAKPKKVGRPKKRKPRTVTITEQEENFIQAILAGEETLTAYRMFWENDYTDAKARYRANLLLKKEHIIQRIEQVILNRKSDVEVDDKFVIDILKHIAIKQKDKRPNSSLSAAIALGKSLGMFVEKIEVDDRAGHRELSRQIWERRQAKINGEEVKPLEEIEKETETEVIEFKLKDGTNDS